MTATQEVKVLFSSSCFRGSAPFSAEPRDDIYGLACLAYELLSGSSPSRVPRGRGGPQRIRGLSRRRWNALRKVLAARGERRRSVETFLSEFALSSGRRRHSANNAEPWRARALRFGIAALAVGVLGAALYATQNWLVREGADRTMGQREAASASAESAAHGRDAETLHAGAEHPGEAPEMSADAELTATDEPNAAAPALLADPGAVLQGERAGIGSRQSENVGLQAGRPPEDSIDAEPRARDLESVARQEPLAAGGSGDRRPSASAFAASVDARSVYSVSVRAEPDAERIGRGVVGPGPSTLIFAKSAVTVSEGDGVVRLEIKRLRGDGPVSVAWWTSEGTAQAGDDYADFGAVVEAFTRGEQSRVIYIPIADDSAPEDREYFYVHLGATAGSEALGALTEVVVWIVDDDR